MISNVRETMVGGKDDSCIITKLRIAFNQIKYLSKICVGLGHFGTVHGSCGPTRVFVPSSVGIANVQEGIVVHLPVHVLQEQWNKKHTTFLEHKCVNWP